MPHAVSAKLCDGLIKFFVLFIFQFWEGVRVYTGLEGSWGFLWRLLCLDLHNDPTLVNDSGVFSFQINPSVVSPWHTLLFQNKRMHSDSENAQLLSSLGCVTFESSCICFWLCISSEFGSNTENYKAPLRPYEAKANLRQFAHLFAPWEFSSLHSKVGKEVTLGKRNPNLNFQFPHFCHLTWSNLIANLLSSIITSCHSLFIFFQPWFVTFVALVMSHDLSCLLNILSQPTLSAQA